MHQGPAPPRCAHSPPPSPPPPPPPSSPSPSPSQNVRVPPPTPAMEPSRTSSQSLHQPPQPHQQPLARRSVTLPIPPSYTVDLEAPSPRPTLSLCSADSCHSLPSLPSLHSLPGTPRRPRSTNRPTSSPRDVSLAEYAAAELPDLALLVRAVLPLFGAKPPRRRRPRPSPSACASSSVSAASSFGSPVCSYPPSPSGHAARPPLVPLEIPDPPSQSHSALWKGICALYQSSVGTQSSTTDTTTPRERDGSNERVSISRTTSKEEVRNDEVDEEEDEEALECEEHVARTLEQELERKQDVGDEHRKRDATREREGGGA